MPSGAGSSVSTIVRTSTSNAANGPRMAGTCRFGRLFARCGADGVATCQYCARAFCAAHGTRADGDQQVCARERCRRKVSDLAAHLVFRERALLRNRHGLCGIEGCRDERWGQCSKCQALFCEEHLFDRSETVRQGMASFSRPASFCEHCLRRRKLWQKR